MNLRVFAILFILLFFISLNGEVTNNFAYADFLKSEELYDLAIGEYYRSMYNGSKEDTTRALFGIAECYAKSHKFIEAAKTYEKLEDQEINWDAIKLHTFLLTDIKYYYESNKLIDKFIQALPKEKQDSLLIYKAVNLINLGKYNEAEETLNQISTDYPKSRALDIQAIMDESLPLKFKKSGKAVFFQAILPGAGYLYCKMPQTALATLVVNSLFGYTIMDNFKRGNTGSGVFFSVIGTGFYLGSIYGSLQAVSKYNKREMENFSNKIRP